MTGATGRLEAVVPSTAVIRPPWPRSGPPSSRESQLSVTRPGPTVRLPDPDHLDVKVSDLAAPTTACVARGAEALGEVVRDEDGSLQVMLDAEGNEFCLVT